MDTLDKQHQDYKKYGTQGLSFLDGQNYQLCLQHWIRKHRTEKNPACKDTRLPFTIWSFLDIWILNGKTNIVSPDLGLFKMFFFSKKFKFFSPEHCYSMRWHVLLLCQV